VRQPADATECGVSDREFAPPLPGGHHWADRGQYRRSDRRRIDVRRATPNVHSPFVWASSGLVTIEDVQVQSPVADPAAGRSGDGDLGIQERRSWATWQLAVVALVFTIVGMLIGYSGKRPAKAAASGAPVSLSGLSGASQSSGSVRSSSSTSTTAGSLEAGPASELVTTTTAALTSSSPTAACTSPSTILMPNTTGQGPDQLPAFTATGAWCIGWVFDCEGAPGGTASFAIAGTPTSGTTPPPAVQQSGRQVSGNTPGGTAGSFHLTVTTDPGCRWAAKVSE